MVYTYQDFIKLKTEGGRITFIKELIDNHKTSELYLTAQTANNYDRQQNETIMNYVKTLFTESGNKVLDFTAANNKIASNFFRRLNVQRNTYSLGNGLQFTNEATKKAMGKEFDTRINRAGYLSLIHGVSFLYWNVDHVQVYSALEFVPLFDEETGALMAGVRFWQISPKKPLFATLYEVDGYTKYKQNVGGPMKSIAAKKGYKLQVEQSQADGEVVVGEDNYEDAFPIVPVYGSQLRQSTLVGMRSSIDSFDLIRSGFANDLTDCAQIYWIIENAGGMTDADRQQLRDRMKLTHFVDVDSDGGVQIKPYTQEIPFAARSTYLADIRNGMYEDFGGFDVHKLAAGPKTATEINAAYQPLDENADDFEYQITESVIQIASFAGYQLTDDDVIYKRNRVANTTEQVTATSTKVSAISSAATYFDEETVVTLLVEAFGLPESDIKAIISRKDAEATSRFGQGDNLDNPDETIVDEV